MHLLKKYIFLFLGGYTMSQVSHCGFLYAGDLYS